MRKGYGFYWHPYQLPILVDREGNHVQLELDNFVPKLPTVLDEVNQALDPRDVPVPWVSHHVMSAPGAEGSSDDETSSKDSSSSSDSESGKDDEPVDKEPSPTGRPSGGDSAGGEPVQGESRGDSTITETKQPELQRVECEKEYDLKDAIPEAKKQLLKAQALSKSHLLFHKPFNPFCDGCNAAKMQDVQHFKGSFDEHPKAWGDRMTCDHMDSRSAVNTGLIGKRQALIIKDLYSKLKDVYPQRPRTPRTLSGPLPISSGNVWRKRRSTTPCTLTRRRPSNQLAKTSR